MSAIYRLVRPAAQPSIPLQPDAAQRAVVEHQAGPMLVLAGPGTGKTATLVEAVAAKVAGGVPPDRVLVLTFSRKAAGELRSRIATRVGLTTQEMLARTFHSYAFGLLRREAAAQGLPAPRLLSGPEQDLVIRDLLAGDVEAGARAWPESLHAALLAKGFARELRDLILRAVERGVTPETLAELGREVGRADWLAAAEFMQQYAQVTALTDGVAYDPAELIHQTVALLDSDSETARQETLAYDWVFVDEYQDCDPAQEALLARIAGGGRNLIVVGDPDQSIYGFRGAEPDCLQAFPERFRTLSGEPAAIVALTRCHRSGPLLLKAAERIAERLGAGRAVRSAGHRARVAVEGAPEGSVEAHVFSGANQQASYIAHRLREAHLLGGLQWRDMAVLVRSTTGALPSLRRALSAAGVPVAVRGAEIPLVRHAFVGQLLTLFRAALVAEGDEALDEEAAVGLLTSALGGADALALRRLRQALRRLEVSVGGRRSTGALLVEAICEPANLVTFEPEVAAPALRVAGLLAAARGAIAGGGSAEDVLWAIWSESGLAWKWQQASLEGGARGAAADRDLDAVVALFDAAARFTDRLPKAGPAVFLDHLARQEIPGDTLAERAPSGNAVQILTAHASKGLEWELVVIAGVQEGEWPDLRLRGSLLGSELLVDIVAQRSMPGAAGTASTVSRLLDEERRLFYVAATRARSQLIVTAVCGEDQQPSRFLDELCPTAGQARVTTPVPRMLSLPALVAELRSVVTAPGEAEGRRRAAARQLARLAAAGVPGAAPASWWGVAPLSDDGPLRGPEETVRVSPSKVEKFTSCQLRWLLESCGGSDAPAAGQTVGSAVHALAELTVDETLVDETALGERLDAMWAELDLGSGWYSRQERERAQLMIRRLVRWLQENPRKLLGVEQDFDVEVGRARLVGRVDRLELDDDGRAVIVDFKTGSQRPTNDELGENPQLGTYQLAAELGAFAELGGVASGGASLVQLGKAAFTHTAREQAQPALSESGDPDWSRRMVLTAAEGMASSTFNAMENKHCGVCPVRRSCPVQPEGQAVTA